MKRVDKNPVNELLIIEAFKSSGYLTVNKTLIKQLGLLPAVILSNLIDKYSYFLKSEKLNNGWFFQTHEQQTEQTGLNDYQIRQIKKELINKEFIQTKRMGVPAKEWYKINFNIINEGLVLQNLKDLPFKNQSTYIKENKYKENKYNNTLSNSKKDKNLSFLPLAEYLYKIIYTKKHIKFTPSQLKSWANEIRKLHEQKVSIKRIEEVLGFYEEHIGEQYIPVVQSGMALREKFLRLEKAMKRNGYKQTQKPNTQGSRMFGSKTKYKEPDEVITQDF